MLRIISGILGELVGPCVDEGMAIDVVDAGHDAFFELVLRVHPDVTQDGAGEIREEALDEIEPGAVLGCEGEPEASRWSSVEPGSCFFRYVGGMIIEDQLDRGAGRISGVETLEEFDELSAAVAVSDERMDRPGKQVDSGQQAKRAMTFVLVNLAQRSRGRRAWAAN